MPGRRLLNPDGHRHGVLKGKVSLGGHIAILRRGRKAVVKGGHERRFRSGSLRGSGGDPPAYSACVSPELCRSAVESGNQAQLVGVSFQTHQLGYYSFPYWRLKTIFSPSRAIQGFRSGLFSIQQKNLLP